MSYLETNPPLSGQPFVIGNFESPGTLARFTFNVSSFGNLMAVLLGVDFTVSGVIPNTLIAKGGFADGSLFFAEGQSFSEGSSHVEWRGQMPLPAGSQLQCSCNSTAAVQVSVFAWGIITAWPLVGLL